MVMSPKPVASALMLFTTVLSDKLPPEVTSRWLPMKTDAPSTDTVAAVTRTVPVLTLALTMPPSTVN